MNHLQNHIDNYLVHCQTQKRLDAKTLKAYRIDLRQFSEQISITESTELTPAVLETYIAKLHQQYAPLPCCRSTFGRTIWKPNTSKRYPYDRAGIRHIAVRVVPYLRIAWCIWYCIHAYHALQLGRQ